jgi:hypothetical protein
MDGDELGVFVGRDEGVELGDTVKCFPPPHAQHAVYEVLWW